MPWPLVWQKRQMPSQQVTTRPAPIKRVEQTNIVMVRGPGQEIEVSLRRDSYAIEVDRGRNCYTYRGFGHLAHHCKNWRRVAEGRRLRYEKLYEYKNNLKGEENLSTLD